PYPARTAPLPHGRFTPDAAWLGSLLANKYPGVVAQSLEVVQLFDSHTTKLRVAVDWNAAGRAAGLPRNLCIKSNWSGMFDDVDIHALEARFYHFLTNKLTANTATCYYADWDDDGSAHGVIVLEDLIDRGGKFGHSTQHAGVDGVANALADLAKLHAGLWESPLITPEAAPWLPTSMAVPVDYDQVRIMWHWIEENLKDPNFRAIAPRHYLDDARRVERAYDRLVTFERAFDAPYCIILGDCHQGNTYIEPNGERMWVDWQLGRRGRPWRDLTYFTVGSLTIEERRQNHRDLIAHYRDCLIREGATNVIDLDTIWNEQVPRWVMYGIQAWVANMDYWGQNGLPMNERFFAAGEDLGSWKLLGE
ncbi:ecdysteroid 22-kinase family protein, partial [Sphingobium sp. IP1]|uniref:ecdysteroid 22-kinase family protein n=1 Tax=Sphingobium sp. IP1 TaxID=2021637 RepID=UPI00211F0ACB